MWDHVEIRTKPGAGWARAVSVGTPRGSAGEEVVFLAGGSWCREDGPRGRAESQLKGHLPGLLPTQQRPLSQAQEMLPEP